MPIDPTICRIAAITGSQKAGSSRSRNAATGRMIAGLKKQKRKIGFSIF
jgi:thioester reductase-like protein